MWLVHKDAKEGIDYNLEGNDYGCGMLQQLQTKE